MPNNKKSETERNADPNPSERQSKRTPSAGADKSGEAVGKQSTTSSDKGASSETGARSRRGKR